MQFNYRCIELIQQILRRKDSFICAVRATSRGHISLAIPSVHFEKHCAFPLFVVQCNYQYVAVELSFVIQTPGVAYMK